MRGSLTTAVLTELLERLGGETSGVTTKEVVVGLSYTAVRLSSDDIGLANTPLEDFSPDGCRLTSRAGTLSQLSPARLAKFARSWELSERVIGIAALNALSQFAIRSAGDEMTRLYGDVVDLTKVERSDTIVMVGNMRPSVEKLRRRAKRVLVLERSMGLRDKNTFPDTAVEDVVPRGDVVFVTGATLCNGTLDRILQLSGSARDVVLVGPSAGIFPPPLFRRGATAVATLEIVDREGAMRGVREGGGTSAIRRCSREVVYRPKVG